MRRMLFGLALAFGSIAAVAGPPTPPAVSVEVVNTPLRVTTPQVTIPIDKWGGLGIKGFGCGVVRNDGQPWFVMATCLSEPPVELSSPVLIWEVLFMPSASGEGFLGEPAKAASCSAVYWLSLDNGVSVRIAEASWSPGQYQSIVVPLPVPIELPTDSVVVQRIDASMHGGVIGNQCNVSTRALYSRK